MRRGIKTRVEYGELPLQHYKNVRWLRDALAACVLLEPSLANLTHARQIGVADAAGHALGDLLCYARTSLQPSFIEALSLRLIERNEVLRLAALMDAGVCWVWYSEWYAAILRELLDLECTYLRLALSYDERLLGSTDL